MYSDDFNLKIPKIETKQLLRISLKEKNNYNSDTLDEVEKELRNRCVQPAELTNKVKIKYNNEAVEEGTIDEAIAKLDEEISEWDIWYFKNYLDEYLAIQSTYVYWVVNYFDDAENGTTFCMKQVDAIKSMLKKFLKLEEWEPDEDDKYNLDDWEAFHTSDSQSYVDSLVKQLEKAQIPYFIRNLTAWHFNAIYGTQSFSNPYVVMVQDEYIEDCNEVLLEIEKTAKELWQKLSRAEKSNDISRQLEIYEKLENVTINDSALFFNKGCILAELNQFDEAADAFIQSITIDLNDGNTNAAYESEANLSEVLQHTPENTIILHCLAHVAACKDNFEEAIALYEKIVSIDENDSIAHLSVGFLYYENSSDNYSAHRHLKRYLELEPDAEDKENIEEILANLL